MRMKIKIGETEIYTAVRKKHESYFIRRCKIAWEKR